MKDWRSPSVGNFLRWKGAVWCIRAKAGGVLQLVGHDTDENGRLPVPVWQQGCYDGSIEMVEHPASELPPDRRELVEVPFAGLPESMRNAVLRMQRYVEAFEDPPGFYERWLPNLPPAGRCVPDSMSARKVTPLLAHVAATLAKDETPPGFSTFAGWVRRWHRYRDWKLMAPRYDKRGAPERTIITGPLQRIVDQAIREVWMTPARNPKAAVAARIEADVLRRNRRHPENRIGVSRRQVHRYVAESVDRYEEAVARQGRRAADARFKPVFKGPEADFVYEVLEVDHTQAKIEVVDDETGGSLGRPWITAALDRRSRMVAGLHVHFDGPCLHAVMQCLRNTLQPKGFLRKLVPQLDYDYPCAGTPVKFFFDRGDDFDNEHVHQVGLEIDVRIAYAPGEQPEYKGSIERFLGTLHKQVALPIRGGMRRVGDRVADARSAKGEATMAFSDFYERLWHWATMVYAKSFHEGVRDTPLSAWEESAAVRLPRPPPPKAKIDQFLMRTVRCEATNRGVRYAGLIWNGDVIKAIRAHPGSGVRQEVLVRLDDGDVGNAWAMDPVTGLPQPLTPVLAEYMRGTSMHLHQLVMRKVEKRRVGTHSERSLIEAKDRMVEEASKTWSLKGTGSKTRARLARLAGIGTIAPAGDDLGSLDPQAAATAATASAKVRQKPVAKVRLTSLRAAEAVATSLEAQPSARPRRAGPPRILGG